MRLNKYCIWLMLKHEISLRWINDKYVSKWLSLRIFQYFMREYIYCFSIFSIFHKLIVFWKFLSIRTTWGQKTKLVPLEKADKVLLFSFSFFVFSSLYYISNSNYRQVDGVEYVCNVRLCDCLLGGIGGLQGGSEVCRAEREREGRGGKWVEMYADCECPQTRGTTAHTSLSANHPRATIWENILNDIMTLSVRCLTCQDWGIIEICIF